MMMTINSDAWSIWYVIYVMNVSLKSQVRKSCWNAVRALESQRPDLAPQPEAAERPMTGPRCAAACDVDPACQMVLRSHSDPPEVIVADLLSFVNQGLLPQLHNKIDEARAASGKRLLAAKAAGKKTGEKSQKGSKQKNKEVQKKPLGRGKGRRTGRPDAAQESIENELQLEGNSEQELFQGDEATAVSEHGRHGAETNEGENLLLALMNILRPETFPAKVKALDGRVLDLAALARERRLIVMAGSVCKEGFRAPIGFRV